MNFKKAYEFPLEVWESMPSKVFTKNGGMAFDFISYRKEGLVAKLDNESKINIVKCLNGEGSKPTSQLDLIYENDGIIKIVIEGKKYDIITIRGWGNLTAKNCLNLTPEKALKIQNEFAEFIIKTLKNVD